VLSRHNSRQPARTQVLELVFAKKVEKSCSVLCPPHWGHFGLRLFVCFEIGSLIVNAALQSLHW